MRKLLSTIFLGLLIMAVSSCETTSSSDGDLDNYWYLTQIDTLSTGSQTNVRQQRIFWGFASTIMQTQIVNGLQYHYSFDHSDSQLRVYNPMLSDRMNGDIPIKADSAFILQPYGINGIEDTFAIEQLNGDAMTLRSKILRLHFERY